MAKIIYYILRVYSKRKALDYAIYRQIKSTKNNKPLEWKYWHNKIMNHGM